MKEIHPTHQAYADGLRDGREAEREIILKEMDYIEGYDASKSYLEYWRRLREFIKEVSEVLRREK